MGQQRNQRRNQKIPVDNENGNTTSKIYGIKAIFRGKFTGLPHESTKISNNLTLHLK